MTEKEIIALIDIARADLSETNIVEFKDARGGIPKDLWKTVSSFSHKPGGGIIVFGIKEDRFKKTIEVVDSLDLATLQEKIVGLINGSMRNTGEFELEVVTYEKMRLLALIIKETIDEKKPCYLYKLGLPRGACIRDGNTNRTITDDEMRGFIRNNSIFKFDKTKAKGTNIRQLSEDKIRDFLIKSAKKSGRVGIVDNNPTKETMDNVGVTDKFEEGRFPTVGGFLIFADKSPQLVGAFSRYVIRCVRYSGDTVASPIIDKSDIDGTLDQQIDSVQKFILRNIPLRARIKGTKRVEEYEYPEDAIRELVANAVIHRDYMITESYTQINIFSNRFEISNPGNLPPGINIENIKDSQFSRNEIIAQILKDLDYLEEYGRGIDIVFSRMSEQNLLEPVFKNTSNMFRVTLLGSKYKDLNERQVAIWNLLQDEKKITSRQCGELFGSVSKATIATDLSKLVSIGLLKPHGKSSSTYYTSVC